MALKSAFIIAALLASSCVLANSKIYGYVDEQGTRHFTDVPDNNRYRLLALSSQDRTAAAIGTTSSCWRAPPSTTPSSSMRPFLARSSPTCCAP
jgi:hypothetical protein